MFVQLACVAGFVGMGLSTYLFGHHVGHNLGREVGHVEGRKWEREYFEGVE